MPIPLDLERLRHIRATSGCDSAPRWKAFKDAVDEIAGVLVNSGLVHALLFAIRSAAKKPAATDVLTALCGWLGDSKCPVRDEAAAVCATPAAAASTRRSAERIVIGLIEMTSVSAAMAIEAEVYRYLAQAKLVADAFKGD